MNKKIILGIAFIALIFMAISCYNNKEDILAVPRVSFRGEIVPILTGSACGCHNNGVSSRAVQFSHGDTLLYDVMLARLNILKTWVNGGSHPAEGSVDFTTNEKALIKKWIDQGSPYDDGSGCTISGTLTYTNDILPIYYTTCKGSTCHGGIAVALDYSKLVSVKNTLVTMMNSGGSTGHPGGALSLSACTINKISTWINQGQLQ